MDLQNITPVTREWAVKALSVISYVSISAAAEI